MDWTGCCNALAGLFCLFFSGVSFLATLGGCSIGLLGFASFYLTILILTDPDPIWQTCTVMTSVHGGLSRSDLLGSSVLNHCIVGEWAWDYTGHHDLTLFLIDMMPRLRHGHGSYLFAFLQKFSYCFLMMGLWLLRLSLLMTLVWLASCWVRNERGTVYLHLH